MSWRMTGVVSITPTGDHDGLDGGVGELAYDGRGFRLQLVLHHQQSQKREVTLHLLPSNPLDLDVVEFDGQLFPGKGDNSVPVLGVRL